MSGPADPGERLHALGSAIRDEYVREKRVMAFAEYFALVQEQPRTQARSSAQYIKDVFEFFGTREVKRPHGTLRRFALFDCPWQDGHNPLLGQEEVQNKVYRALSHFCRQGRVNKLILLHGPNGSAKSTFVACIMRALGHYSRLDEGALYRFNWVFPSDKASASGIGFSGRGESQDVDERPRDDTFAYLADDQVDARLTDNLRDHPLLLLPRRRRNELLDELVGDDADFVLSDYLRHGDLSPKNRQIYEGLLAKYRGDYEKVLRHVQVERFYVRRRYREGAVTVEPQLHVDASTRQITADRSTSALPPALQSVTLHEYAGDLVGANRGVIEYADMLKRPMEAYKYLLSTVEESRVPVDEAILHLDLTFVGSTNESHLAVFKELPDFQSFKGRLELVRVPFVLDYKTEERIYDEKLSTATLDKHVAPHTTLAVALWAVLTRMRKPLPEKYEGAMAELVQRLSPMDKAELYARAVAPPDFGVEQTREITANIDQVWEESESYPNYEGRTGASPREVSTLLLNAAANTRFKCLSPAAVFAEMEELVREVTVYEFLKQEPLPGGYHENRKFIATTRDRVLALVDEQLRACMGLVDEGEYARVFERYITHTTHWIRKEKVRNEVTGAFEDPSEVLMSEIETPLDVGARRDEFRQQVISRIGAWSIDHPNQSPVYADIFAKEFAVLRDSYFDDRKDVVKKTLDDVLVLLTDGPAQLQDSESRERAQAAVETLTTESGYCPACLKEAVSLVRGGRYAD